MKQNRLPERHAPLKLDKTKHEDYITETGTTVRDLYGNKPAILNSGNTRSHNSVARCGMAVK
jgi:hypothetical protein